MHCTKLILANEKEIIDVNEKIIEESHGKISLIEYCTNNDMTEYSELLSTYASSPVKTRLAIRRNMGLSGNFFIYFHYRSNYFFLYQKIQVTVRQRCMCSRACKTQGILNLRRK